MDAEIWSMDRGMTRILMTVQQSSFFKTCLSKAGGCGPLIPYPGSTTDNVISLGLIAHVYVAQGTVCPVVSLSIQAPKGVDLVNLY